MLCNWSYKWSWRARSNSTENESVFPLKSSRVTFKIHFAGKCLASFNSSSFCVAVFICLFWPLICKWNHQLLNLAPCSPRLVNPKQGQAINSRPTSKASQVIWEVWHQDEVKRLQVSAMLPLMEEPDPEVLPTSASCFLWVGESSFYPCQMKLEAIWKQGTSRQLEFKILLPPKVLSPGTLLLVKKVGKQAGYLVNFQSISLIRCSTKSSVNSWIKSILIST